MGTALGSPGRTEGLQDDGPQGRQGLRFFVPQNLTARSLTPGNGDWPNEISLHFVCCWVLGMVLGTTERRKEKGDPEKL
jgi:hypothetical protein